MNIICGSITTNTNPDLCNNMQTHQPTADTTMPTLFPSIPPSQSPVPSPTVSPTPSPSFSPGNYMFIYVHMPDFIQAFLL